MTRHEDPHSRRLAPDDSLVQLVLDDDIVLYAPDNHGAWVQSDASVSLDDAA